MATKIKKPAPAFLAGARVRVNSKTRSNCAGCVGLVLSVFWSDDFQHVREARSGWVYVVQFKRGAHLVKFNFWEFLLDDVAPDAVISECDEQYPVEVLVQPSAIPGPEVCQCCGQPIPRR